MKYDGYRLRVERHGDRVKLTSRSGLNWTGRFPWIVETARKIRQTHFVLDGEAVVLGVTGDADFDSCPFWGSGGADIGTTAGSAHRRDGLRDLGGAFWLHGRPGFDLNGRLGHTDRQRQQHLLRVERTNHGDTDFVWRAVN